MYPIQNGPSVPWEVMLPHESISQKNHGQSIGEIARRGGFGCAEAYCIVNDIEHSDLREGIGYQEARKRWLEFAERINLHYDKITTLEREKAESEARYSNQKVLLDNANKACEQYISITGKQAHELKAKSERIVELEKALKPFASWVSILHWGKIKDHLTVPEAKQLTAYNYAADKALESTTQENGGEG